ncbi:uncharacterized protein C8A04DRAFT_30514 [Dichotomopilus funicola]|uniref:Uncharacterized protein n=1 Tax=Dichotomopilus funicola TaxID=1934379 RepID=A0AAN6UZ65_9PEZI|nr:hypothetical protein C8A04DRAFT_30514 [Dichotomopilus funicola]
MHATILTVAFLLGLRAHAAPTPLTDAVTSSTSITIGDNLDTTAEPLDTPTTIIPSTLDESSDETPDETPENDERSVYITIGDTVNRVASESSPSDADNANLQRLLELLTEHLARVKQSADSATSSNESSGFQRVPTSKALAHEDHGHEEEEEDKNGRPANAVIINKADMFPEGDKHEQQQEHQQPKGEQHHEEASDFKDYQRQGQFKPQNQGGEGQEAVGFTIFCKGISVCNPVTIINGKGGRKLKIDKLEKFGRKSKGKLGEKFKKPF